MEKIILSIDERLALLEKPLWNYLDIARFFGANKNKALDIKKAARVLNGGKPKYDPSRATVKSVFEAQGLDLDAEISRLKLIKREDAHIPADGCDA